MAFLTTFAAVGGGFLKPQAQEISPNAKRENSQNNGDTSAPVLFPAPQATLVNPDVQLKLTFKNAPRVGTSGKVRIYDAADDRLVDALDLSIPPGPTKPVDPAVRAKNYLAFPYPYERTTRPTNRDTKPGTPSAGAAPTSNEFQLTIIGGFTDGFHFYPVTVNENTATIHPHHDLLEYGKTYYVEVDAGVLKLPDDGFQGISGKSWRFTTKPKSKAPRLDAKRLTVAADGTGDFNTVQGAMDFVPDHSLTMPPQETPTAIPPAPPNNALPPTQTDYVAPPRGSVYDTGELVQNPGSVTEATTRHLEIDSEGETMTLPKK